MKRDNPFDGADQTAAADRSPGPATGDGAARSSEPDPPGPGASAGADPTGAATPGPDAAGEGDPLEVEHRLESLHEEIATLNDQHLRLAAEFQNYRKRVGREREELRARSQAELVGVLLDALDDLERVTGVDPSGASVESLIEGVDLVERKLQRALETAGAETIDAVGKRFDPETMEAIGTVPTDDPEADDTVAATFQRGYRMHGILVRPARVQVLKHAG